ncbi:hypothetical protein ACFPER_17855 [Agromyces aurantiacus]|uniref:Uncharacterized protein n=1 Tax=Agromyces aurantiacus TaxID=165814 RepID=A0ABV9RAT1_9MICO|nr:hypothetical protein [Agromyces aurantiacus]MBM7505355.1 hypothetical protein [Agromyces aurantiacus]
MTEDDQRDPMQRLRAADPAAGVEPRDGFADEVVARAAGDSAGRSRPADTEAPVADLTGERARRRPRWLPVAAVAASLVVVGAVGYGVGAAAPRSGDLADGAAPPIALEGGTGGAGATGATTGAEAASPDQQKMAAPGTTDAMLYPWSTGRNSFTASGLSTEAGTATAYAFDARSASNADTVAALAAALGVDGTPELRDGSWVVGSQDGTAPSLWVSLDGTLTFSYSDPGINPWICPDGADACEPSGALPSEQAAIDAARSLVSSAGRDVAAFEFTSETWEGAVTRMAQAWPIVDGQRVDQAWNVELSEDGIVSASGALAPLVSLGEYPVVSEQAAFERLSDPRFSAQMTGLPIAMREATADATTEWVPPTEPPATPAAGASLSWPVNDVEIVDARLGLASQWQADGSVVVVPAYEFTDADGGTWSIIAVADEQLDFSTE